MTIPAPSATAAPERFAALDLLRLVAALAVVGFHYLFRGAAGAEPYLDAGYPELAPIALYGYLGVSLFFMISGFVIAWSAQGRGWGSFALSRFSRLYPGFAICMSLTALGMWLAGDARLPVTLAQFGANFLIFAPAAGQGFVDGVYWSIVLELIFYGWMALAIASGQFARRPLTLVAGWLVLAAINELALDNGALRLLLVTEYAGWFAAGILGWHMRAAGRASAGALVLLGASFVLCALTATRVQDWMAQHYGQSVPDAVLPFAVAAIFALFGGTLRWGGALRPRFWILAAGGLTYPLYLLHQHLGYLALNLATPLLGRWVALLAVVLGMVAASLAVWFWLERPLQAWLRQRLKPVASRLDAVGQRRVDARGSSRKAA